MKSDKKAKRMRKFRKQLERRIKATYTRERISALVRLGRKNPQWTPGTYWDGGVYLKRGAEAGSKPVRRPSIWEKIADWYVANDMLDYERVLQTLFQAYYPIVPEPNQMYGVRATQLYESKKNFAELLLEPAFETQKEVAKQKLFASSQMGMTNAEAWSAMFQDRNISLSALFRYCLAVSEGYSHFAKLYHDEAMLQYLAHRKQYDKIWKEWIPTAFRREADAYRLTLGKA